jgi:branched-chain amino acid transport system ATP-binding protein
MLLEVRNITKSFGGLKAVNDVSMSVETGEILGLIGPNGSGKTTLFNVISGFYPPDKGRTIFDGKDITGLRPDIISRLGLVRTFQLTRPLSNLSALENVRVGAFMRTKSSKEATRSAWKILERIECSKIGHLHSHKLTYGQKKILEVGRALATQPKLLCLDETVAGLNAKEAMEVINLLGMIHQEGVTLILIEHNMTALLSIAKRIVVLNSGFKIADGLPDEVIRSNEVIEAYLGKEDNQCSILEK